MKLLGDLQVQLVSGGTVQSFFNGWEPHYVNLVGVSTGISIAYYLVGGASFATLTPNIFFAAWSAGLSGGIILSAIFAWGRNQEKQYLA